MNIIELLILIFIISAGHFLGSMLESRLGLTGWLAGCVLGVGISLLIITVFRFVVKHVKSARDDDSNKQK